MEEVIKKLEEQDDLHLKLSEEDRKDENLFTFLLYFFKDYNRNRATYYTKNGQVQTRSGKRRSIDDVYKICKHYYPGVTLRKVAELLFKELPETMQHFRTSYCTTINKRVFYYDPLRHANVYNKTHRDQHGLVWDDWCKFVDGKKVKPQTKKEKTGGRNLFDRDRIRERIEGIAEEQNMTYEEFVEAHRERAAQRQARRDEARLFGINNFNDVFGE